MNLQKCDLRVKNNKKNEISKIQKNRKPKRTITLSFSAAISIVSVYEKMIYIFEQIFKNEKS